MKEIPFSMRYNCLYCGKTFEQENLILSPLIFNDSVGSKYPFLKNLEPRIEPSQFEPRNDIRLCSYACKQSFLFEYLSGFSENQLVSIGNLILNQVEPIVYSKSLIFELIENIIKFDLYSIFFTAHGSAQIISAQKLELAHGSKPYSKIRLEPRAELSQTELTKTKGEGISLWL